MSSPNKRRGTAFESAVCRYMNSTLGLLDDDGKFRSVIDPMNVRRQAQTGARDVGDIWAWPFVLECKDVKAPAVPTWIRQAEAEATNAGFPYGVVVHKVRRDFIRSARVYVSNTTHARLADHYPGVPLPFEPVGAKYMTCSLGAFTAMLGVVREGEQ